MTSAENSIRDRASSRNSFALGRSVVWMWEVKATVSYLSSVHLFLALKRATSTHLEDLLLFLVLYRFVVVYHMTWNSGLLLNSLGLS